MDMEKRRLKRPPPAGETKRAADAEAPVLRAQVRTVMRLDALSTAAVAKAAAIDTAALSAFLAGASLSPHWTRKLARWLDAAIDQGPRP